MAKEVKTKNVAFAGCFGVLTAAGAYITIPLPWGVPITGQTFFVLLAGLVLGARWGAVAMITYLTIGGAGFPVFHGGTGGIGVLFGPTGGYLVGFPVAAFIVGHISQHAFQKTPRYRRAFLVLAVAVGSLIIYAFGVPWLAFVAKLNFSAAVMGGMIPFLPGDAIKAAGSVLVAETLWSTISFGPIWRREK